jgi:hypothetical protein
MRTLMAAGAAYACTTDGNAQVRVTGELKQWHKVTLTLDGPCAREKDTDPNPFLDYRMTITFAHESAAPKYEVPAYFAADGNAANTSADMGTAWRAHVSPDKPGRWTYQVSFTKGKNAGVDGGGQPVARFDGQKGEFRVGPTDKKGRDFRAKGRLQYVGRHYLQFAGTREYFLKAGSDSPETLLGYKDFDGTETRKVALKTYEPHPRDWKAGDPTWSNGKGKGLIGAVNYLASEGMNALSLLTYNAAGDGDTFGRSSRAMTSCTTTVRSSISGESCSITPSQWAYTSTSGCRKPKMTTNGSAANANPTSAAGPRSRRDRQRTQAVPARDRRALRARARAELESQ